MSLPSSPAAALVAPFYKKKKNDLFMYITIHVNESQYDSLYLVDKNDYI